MVTLPIWYVCALPLIALCVGHFVGTRSEANYWRDHGENGGSVYYRKQFYKVTKERN